jgi:RNA polymerase sigma-70 factor (ECF subfamily)
MNQFSDPKPSGSNSIALVEGILAEDQVSGERLFATYKRGLVFFFTRQLGPQQAEDLASETLTIVWEAVRAGSVREPERLPGFVMTVARRLGCRVIEERIASRQGESPIDHDPEVFNGLWDLAESPEDTLLRSQQETAMLKVLQSLSEREREVLERFYLHEQSPERIQTEMGMTETQFRLTKSRAKARFALLGKQLGGPPAIRRTVQRVP